MLNAEARISDGLEDHDSLSLIFPTMARFFSFLLQNAWENPRRDCS